VFQYILNGPNTHHLNNSLIMSSSQPASGLPPGFLTSPADIFPLPLRPLSLQLSKLKDTTIVSGSHMSNTYAYRSSLITLDLKRLIK
jgi:hypothetical protein